MTDPQQLAAGLAYVTARGFNGYAQTTAIGGVVEVQESSAFDPRCWLRFRGVVTLTADPEPIAGLEHGIAQARGSVRMNAAQAREVRDALLRWVKEITGGELTSSDMVGVPDPEGAVQAVDEDFDGLAQTRTTYRDIVELHDGDDVRVVWRGEAHLGAAAVGDPPTAPASISAHLSIGQATYIAAGLSAWLRGQG